MHFFANCVRFEKAQAILHVVVVMVMVMVIVVVAAVGGWVMGGW